MNISGLRLPARRSGAAAGPKRGSFDLPFFVLTLLLLAIGAAAWVWRSWPLWTGVGAAMSAWIFWGLARFFLRRPLGEYSTAFLRVVLVRFGARMLVLAVAVYAALVECAAPPFALVGGLTAGFAVALATFAAASRQATRR